ncbi:MAG: hypothetical protein DRJ15_17460 [Bacteroidetes bacterium]|nr:MAG: hypothetical protein DRJ15_17460 [Bacteroidota bacterium]
MANIDYAFRVDILSLDDKTLISTGDAQPNTGGGYEAPQGSLYLRQNATTSGEVYVKFGPNDVDWNLLGSSDVNLTTIGSNDIPVFVDSTRSDKVLSSTMIPMVFSGNRLIDSSWMQIDEAKDATSGFVIPFNATIVGIATQFKNGKGREIDLYIDGVLDTADVVTIPNITDAQATDMTLDIDITALEKIQLRGSTSQGLAQTGRGLITIYARWRG